MIIIALDSDQPVLRVSVTCRRRTRIFQHAFETDARILAQGMMSVDMLENAIGIFAQRSSGALGRQSLVRVQESH